MVNVIYRRMMKEDIDAVVRIDRDTFPVPWSRRSYEQEMENACARYLVAQHGDEIVAFAGAWMIFEESHITNIAVVKALRGQGIGRGITSALMQYAANLGACYMTLEVRAGNLVAQNLYRSLGFGKASVRKKYYEDNGEDAFVMVTDRLPPRDPDFTEEETVFE